MAIYSYTKDIIVQEKFFLKDLRDKWREAKYRKPVGQAPNPKIEEERKKREEERKKLEDKYRVYLTETKSKLAKIIDDISTQFVNDASNKAKWEKVYAQGAEEEGGNWQYCKDNFDIMFKAHPYYGDGKDILTFYWMDNVDKLPDPLDNNYFDTESLSNKFVSEVKNNPEIKDLIHNMTIKMFDYEKTSCMISFKIYK